MTQKINSICGIEPPRDGEYPWAYVVGHDGVTSIEAETENLGTYGISWFIVKSDDQLVAKMNAQHVAHVGFMKVGAA